MRSNGATHIGNDSFVLATRDDDEHLFLFTSAFPASEQRVDVALERRVRLTPKSTLLDDAAVLKRYLRALAKRSTVESAEPDLVVSSASSSCGDDEEEEEDKDDPSASMRRHALFASPDGHQIVAISNQPHHHYLFDVGKNGHDMVCEFETDALVRSVCWHPEKPRVLFLLLASCEVVCYDTAYSRFGVTYPHALRLDLIPLLQRFGRKEEVEGQDLHAQDDAASEVTAASTREAAASRQPAAPPHRFPLPLNAYGQPDHTYAWDAPRRLGGPASSSMARPQESALLALTDGSAAALPSRRNGTQTALLHLHGDVRDTMSMHSSSLLRPPSMNKAGLASSDAVALTNVHEVDTDAARASLDAAEAEEAAARSKMAAGVRSNTLFTPAPHYGRDIVALTANQDAADARGAKQHESMSRTVQGGSAAEGQPVLAIVHQKGQDRHEDMPLVVRHERDHPTCPFDVVDCCALPGSRSRPWVLLILSSSGDVFTMRLDAHHLPKRTSTTFPDGRLGVTDEDMKRAAHQARHAGAPVVHHLIGRQARTTNEQALRLTAALLDEDTGLCVVTICWSSGALRGIYVDEPDLIARDVNGVADSTRPAVFAGQAGGFTVQLGAALPVAALLSPAVASSSHMVLMEKQGNVLLIRYGQDDSAAYLVALPVWDRARQGWNYWQPSCCSPEVRRREALRLPVDRPGDGSVPAPLALRIPYDVEGASVALGLRELVIAPELSKLDRPTKSARASSATLCPRGMTVVADVASLLKSALIARSTSWAWCGKQSAKPTESTGSAAFPLDLLAECHRSHLCGQPHAVVSAQLDAVGEQLERAIAAVQEEEKKVTQREAALRDRLNAVTQKIRQDAATVETWQATMLNAMVHRRGVEALVTGNDRLGDIHRMLNEYDIILDARREELAAQAAREGALVGREEPSRN